MSVLQSEAVVLICVSEKVNLKGKPMEYEGDMIACDLCGTPIDARNTPQWHELTAHGFLCEPCQERIDDDQ